MKLEFTENMNEMYSAFRATSDAYAWLTKHDANSWGSLAIGRCEYTRGNAVEPNGCYQAIYHRTSSIQHAVLLGCFQQLISRVDSTLLQAVEAAAPDFL
jgi:hypothetical protein